MELGVGSAVRASRRSHRRYRNAPGEPEPLPTEIGTLATFALQMTADQALPANTNFVNITNLEVKKPFSGFALNSGTGEITVPELAWYEIQCKFTQQQTAGNNRTTGYGRLTIDGVEYQDSWSAGYHRQNAHGSATYTLTTLVQLDTDNKVAIQAANASGTLRQTVRKRGFSFHIKKVE